MAHTRLPSGRRASRIGRSRRPLADELRDVAHRRLQRVLGGEGGVGELEAAGALDVDLVGPLIMTSRDAVVVEIARDRLQESPSASAGIRRRGSRLGLRCGWRSDGRRGRRRIGRRLLELKRSAADSSVWAPARGTSGTSRAREWRRDSCRDRACPAPGRRAASSGRVRTSDVEIVLRLLGRSSATNSAASHPRRAIVAALGQALMAALERLVVATPSTSTRRTRGSTVLSGVPSASARR